MSTRKSLKIGLGRIILDLQVYHPLWKWENSSPKDSDSSPALPPISTSHLFSFSIWASQFPTPTSPISSGPSPPSNFNFHLSNLPCPGFPPPSNCFECWQIRSVLSGVQPRAFPFGCQMAHHGRSHRKRVGGELNSQVPEHLAWKSWGSLMTHCRG